MTATAVWQGSNLNIKTPPSLPINSPQISPKISQQPKANKSRNNSKSNNNSHNSNVIKDPQSRNNSKSHQNGPPGLSKNESNQDSLKNGFHSRENTEGAKRNGHNYNANNAWNSSKNWENNNNGNSNESVKKQRENSVSTNENSTSNISQKSLNQERGNKSESISIPTNRSRSNSKSSPYLHPNHPDRSHSGTTPPSLSNSSELINENNEILTVPSILPKENPQQKENHQKNQKKAKGNQSTLISQSSLQQNNSMNSHHSHSNQYIHHNNLLRNIGQAPSNEWIHPIIEKIPSSNCKELSPHPEIFDLEGARGTLSGEQISRLKLLLDEECNIVSKDKSLRINCVTPFKLISKLISRLAMSEIFVLDAGIRLVGSGAAHVLVEPQSSIDVPKDDLKGGNAPPFIESSHLINDIDFCFYVPEGTEFYKILQIQEHVIIEFLEEMQNTRKYSLRDIYTQFFLDSVKVESESPREGWSLITIGEQGQRTIDIKFVIKSKRSWVFSADSFEIVLDPFFQKVVTCYKSVIKFTKKAQWTDALRDAASFYKSASESVSNQEIIKVESLYADFLEAFEHLKNKQLYTKRPEEIRRGIFRYCHELAKGKSPNDSERTKLDKIFVDSFLGEKTANFDFEEVLKKFLVKHISSSLLCLIQLQDIFVRAGYDSSSETQTYMDIIKKKKEEYESIGLHQPIPLLASHESKSSSTKL